MESILIFPSSKCAATSFTFQYFATVCFCHSSGVRDLSKSISILSNTGNKLTTSIGIAGCIIKSLLPIYFSFCKILFMPSKQFLYFGSQSLIMLSCCTLYEFVTKPYASFPRKSFIKNGGMEKGFLLPVSATNPFIKSLYSIGEKSVKFIVLFFNR